MAAPPRDKPDGRVLRGEKNQALIVDATYDLVRGGDADPAPEAIAARAGVGLRTVFRQFTDLEALYRSVSERLRDEVLGMDLASPPTGDLVGDLRVIVARRGKVFEHLAPFRRAGRIARHRSEFLREQGKALEWILRSRIEVVLLPHAGKNGKTGDPALILEAVDLLLSFDAWDRLREGQGLTVERTREVLEAAALAMLR